MADTEEFAKNASNTTNRLYVMHVKHIPPESTNTVGEAILSMDLKQREYKKNSKVSLPPEYQDFAEVFSEVDANKLSDHGLQDYAIDLIDEQQPPYRPVYNLSKVKLAALR